MHPLFLVLGLAAAAAAARELSPVRGSAWAAPSQACSADAVAAGSAHGKGKGYDNDKWKPSIPCKTGPKCKSQCPGNMPVEYQRLDVGKCKTPGAYTAHCCAR